MRRSDGLTPHRSRPYRSRHASRRGYTLVEILTATLLMIIIMMAVTVIFASVTESIGQSRATLEMSQRLRATTAILQQDLKNATATMSPPLHPRDNSGYLQYVEGPIGPVVAPSSVAWNGELSGPDTTVGDIDDILSLTVTTKGEPYVGLIDGEPATSNSAEIIWFIRGRTLYRRVLLIKPEVDVRSVNRAGFYAANDLSVHKIWDYQTDPPGDPSGLHRPVLVANSLADLTQPECRFAHHPDLRVWTRTFATTVPADVASTMLARLDSERFQYEGKVFPSHVRPWMGAPFAANPGDPPKWVPGLGMPILAEMSTPSNSPAYAPGIWMAGDFPPSDNVPLILPVRRWGYNLNDPSMVQGPIFPAGKEVVPNGAFDAWANEHPWNNVDPITGAIADYRANATRIGDDVILTNVIGFDIKAWDPKAPILTVQTPDPLVPSNSVDVVLMPGDPGYIDQVRVLQQTIESRGFTNSGFPTGAYADLNYLAKVPYRTWDHDGSGSTANVACYPDGVASDPADPTKVLLQKPDFARQGNGRSLAYGTQWQFAMGEQPYPPNYNYSVTQPFEYFPAVYDTWSVHFEYNRHTINYVSDNPTDANRASYMVGNEDQDGTMLSSNFVQLYDEGSNGLDDPVRNLAGQVIDEVNGYPIPPSTDPPLYANGVDDVDERETQPPYAVPLQGIQIRIRVFEPGSRQVREVTLIQKFRTK